MFHQHLESVATFEHFSLDFDAQSSAQLVNHRFTEDTIVEHTFLPGLYISMLGKCQCQAMNNNMSKKSGYDHQYVVVVVDQTISSQLYFSNHSLWQSFAIRMPLDTISKNNLLPRLNDYTPHILPQIRFAELGPVPSDILHCCESVWDCPFEGFERELFIKAKAQEVLALFLHKCREQTSSETSRMTRLSNTLSYVQTHLSEDWTLSSVAHLAGSNRTYVKQDIKALVGKSFRDWLKDVRLDAARKELAGEGSITQIAHNIGYKSQAHFATFFKQEVGITPSEYRQSLLMEFSA